MFERNVIKQLKQWKNKGYNERSWMYESKAGRFCRA